MSSRRSLLSTGAAAVLLAVALGAAPAGASEAQVPFQDPYQNGVLTFCDQHGEPVTGGSLDTVPFVWSAISSTAAPTGYKFAYLTIYQPMQHVDPGQWSGYQMTDQSTFSNPAHPVAQATYADQPLLWPDQAYPPYWDDLFEVRMYFSTPQKSAVTSTYPAAVIQITGDSWKLVSGGGGSCSAGKATSLEEGVLPRAETDVPHPVKLVGAPSDPAAGSPVSSTSATTVSTSSTTDRPGPAAPQTTSPTTAHSRQIAAGRAGTPAGGGGSPTELVIGVLLAALLLAGCGAGAVWRSRRHSR